MMCSGVSNVKTKHVHLADIVSQLLPSNTSVSLRCHVCTLNKGLMVMFMVLMLAQYVILSTSNPRRYNKLHRIYDRGKLSKTANEHEHDQLSQAPMEHLVERNSSEAQIRAPLNLKVDVDRGNQNVNSNRLFIKPFDMNSRLDEQMSMVAYGIAIAAIVKRELVISKDFKQVLQVFDLVGYTVENVPANITVISLNKNSSIHGDITKRLLNMSSKENVCVVVSLDRINQTFILPYKGLIKRAFTFKQKYMYIEEIGSYFNPAKNRNGTASSLTMIGVHPMNNTVTGHLTDTDVKEALTHWLGWFTLDRAVSADQSYKLDLASGQTMGEKLKNGKL